VIIEFIKPVGRAAVAQAVRRWFESTGHHSVLRLLEFLERWPNQQVSSSKNSNGCEVRVAPRPLQMVIDGFESRHILKVDKMSDKEKLETELELLLSLNYVHAWTGSLDNLKQSSYILFSDITRLINKKREELRSLNNGT
jgi:hypothetical protein